MDRNNILCKIEFHESEWVGEMGDYIVINTSLRTIVNRVNKLIKKEAESNSSPVRLYASNAYTSLKLLSEALWEHKKEVDNHD